MKGLLMREGYMIRENCRMYLATAALGVAVTVYFGEHFMMFLFYTCILVGMLPSTVFTLDEKERWDRYSAAVLPVSRAELVSVKYIVSLLLCAGLLAADALAIGLGRLLFPENAFTEPLAALGLVFTLNLLFPALMMPVIFRLGAERGRILYFILCVIVGGGCGFLGVVLSTDEGVPEVSPLATLSGWTIPVAMAIALLVFVLSWLLSIAFYRKREL